jgi:hypothetical protein
VQVSLQSIGHKRKALQSSIASEVPHISQIWIKSGTHAGDIQSAFSGARLETSCFFA